jgi:TolB-like protein
MKFNQLLAEEIKFSREEVYEQIQRIFQDASFKGSDILKRFLLFIVEQTLLGHSNWLKEYTIGVKVLNKQSDFKPQESGIVRIHAGRLRRALNHYYDGNGSVDPIYISIPKGSYVPAFSDNIKGATKKEEDDIERLISPPKTITVAVMPFMHINDELKNSFTDGLCNRLSDELMHFGQFSVIPYHIMRNLYEKFDDVKEIASLVEADYIITGDVQSVKDRLRINVQMIETNTSRQLWSKMYERKLSETNFFELQDDISKLIRTEFEDFYNSMDRKSQVSKIVAVA